MTLYEYHSCPECKSDNTSAKEEIKGGAGWYIGVQWHCDDCGNWFQVINGRHDGS